MSDPTRALPAGVQPAPSPSAPSTPTARQVIESWDGPEHVREVALGNRHAVPLTGIMAVDVMGDVVSEHVDPFVQVPLDKDGSVNVPAYVFQIAGGVLSMPSIITDALDNGIAILLSPFAQMMELPAARLFDLHVGMPHGHSHPPSLIPPAPPVPLPSIGNLMLSGAVTVSIGGVPAARAGDVGMALTCGSFAPVFMVVTGSSSVFIGGARAARLGDLTIHCNPILAAVLKMQTAAAVMGALGGAAAVGSAVSQGKALGALAAAAQATADLARDAAKATVGMDPGIPPSVMGAIMSGTPTVLIGGLPVPPADIVLGFLKGELDTEAPRRKNNHHDDSESDPSQPRRNRSGACEC